MIPLLLTSLSNLLSSRQFSIRTLIQTISSIRSYYLKMRKITENNLNISKNSNAQARILILEERLIEMGVLNVDDVKYIEKMEEEEENTRRVGEIVVNVINIFYILIYINSHALLVNIQMILYKNCIVDFLLEN